MVILKGLPYERLRDFLLAHELRIAHGFDEYVNLRELFHLIFDRWPDKVEKKLQDT